MPLGQETDWGPQGADTGVIMSTKKHTTFWIHNKQLTIYHLIRIDMLQNVVTLHTTSSRVSQTCTK